MDPLKEKHKDLARVAGAIRRACPITNDLARMHTTPLATKPPSLDPIEVPPPKPSLTFPTLFLPDHQIEFKLPLIFGTTDSAQCSDKPREEKGQSPQKPFANTVPRGCVDSGAGSAPAWQLYTVLAAHDVAQRSKGGAEQTKTNANQTNNKAKLRRSPRLKRLCVAAT